jgi:putative transcriptional regulator
MPFLQESKFIHSVIYICGHDEQGAIGLIINKHIPNLTFKSLLDQLHLNVDMEPDVDNFEVHYGGPIEVTRGFVLHTNDFMLEASVAVNDKTAITSTLEILRALAQGGGPENYLICLGYTGWTAGQLENEIQENDWLVVESTEDLIFHTTPSDKWRTSMAAIGVDPSVLSIHSGHA